MSRWIRPSSPPAPIFVNDPERNFQKQIAKEVTEFVLNQSILYFAVDVEKTNFHPIYKESVQKVFFQPIEVKVFIDFEDNDTTNTKWGIDRKRKVIVHFHNRRIKEDQNLFVREGDIIYLDNVFYEIWKLSEPEEVWGQIEHKVGTSAYCINIRNSPSITQR